VGSFGEFGYFEHDATGQLRFHAISDRLPKDTPAFGDVWRTFITPNGVIFQSEPLVFRYANDTIEVIRPPSYFNRASLVDGRIHLTMPETGLNVLEGNTFRPCPVPHRSAGKSFLF
jgi:hypothetical protein